MDDEDTQPLLNEENGSKKVFTAAKSQFFSWNIRSANNQDSGIIADSADVFHNIVEENESEPDLIAAVFVVAFDIHSGMF